MGSPFSQRAAVIVKDPHLSFLPSGSQGGAFLLAENGNPVQFLELKCN